MAFFLVQTHLLVFWLLIYGEYFAIWSIISFCPLFLDSSCSGYLILLEVWYLGSWNTWQNETILWSELSYFCNAWSSRMFHWRRINQQFNFWKRQVQNIYNKVPHEYVADQIDFDKLLHILLLLLCLENMLWVVRNLNNIRNIWKQKEVWMSGE